MASATLTAFEMALKILYKGTGIEDAIYKQNPFMSILPKYEDFVGYRKRLPIIYSGNTWSGALATAQTNRVASGIEAWELARINLYSVGRIAKELLEASDSDRGAVMAAAKIETDSALRTISRALSCYLFRDGSGAIGADDGTWSTPSTDIVLSDPADAINFEPGMTIKSATGATGAVDTGTIVVESVARATGTITFTGAVDSGIAAFAASDSLFVEGAAYNNSAYAVPMGLDAWVPSSMPSSAAFCGVDRSVTEKLGGSRYDGSSMGTVEEALINGVNSADPAAAVDLIVCNNMAFAELVKEIGSKVQYNRLPVRTTKGAMDIAKFGFKVVEMEGPAGTVRVLSDPHCPKYTSWAGQLNTAGLHSLKKAVRLDEDDLTVYNADEVEIRCLSRAQFAIQAPGNWVNITLPSY